MWYEIKLPHRNGKMKNSGCLTAAWLLPDAANAVGFLEKTQMLDAFIEPLKFVFIYVYDRNKIKIIFFLSLLCFCFFNIFSFFSSQFLDFIRLLYIILIYKATWWMESLAGKGSAAISATQEFLAKCQEISFCCLFSSMSREFSKLTYAWTPTIKPKNRLQSQKKNPQTKFFSM